MGLGFAALLGSCVLLLGSGRADLEKPSADLGGEYLAVFHSRIPGEPAARATYLAKPVVRTLGTRSFLVGSQIEFVGPAADQADTRLWVALDDIVGIMPFPTLDRMRDHFNADRKP